VVVCGLDGDFNLRRIERYLVLARKSGAEAAVVLNKADVCADVAARLEETARIAGPARVLAISAMESVEPVVELVCGRTVAFLGSSGAGKSTIVNALLGEERQATQTVREADSRGRHTTTSRMLIPLPGGGAIIDNPGMRELQLWATEESLDDVFAEIAGYARGCRYADCTHTSEPKCAVLAALEEGKLDGSRWESYRKLQAELRHSAVQQDVFARLEEKRTWKAIHKSLRYHPKYRR
jgi:ribosome biogenesis GTPase